MKATLASIIRSPWFKVGLAGLAPILIVATTVDLVALYEHTSSATPAAVNTVASIALVLVTIAYVVYTQQLLSAQRRTPHLEAQITAAQDFVGRLAGLAEELRQAKDQHDAVLSGRTKEAIDRALIVSAGLMASVTVELVPAALRLPTSGLSYYLDTVVPAVYSAARQIQTLAYSASFARLTAGNRFILTKTVDEQKAAVANFPDAFDDPALPVLEADVREQYLLQLRSPGDSEWNEVAEGKAITDAQAATMTVIGKLRAYVAGASTN